MVSTFSVIMVEELRTPDSLNGVSQLFYDVKLFTILIHFFSMINCESMVLRCTGNGNDDLFSGLDLDLIGLFLIIPGGSQVASTTLMFDELFGVDVPVQVNGLLFSSSSGLR